MSIMPDWYDAWKLQNNQEPVYVCEGCGEKLDPDSMVTTDKEYSYCEQCFNELFKKCKVCDCYYPIEEMDDERDICLECIAAIESEDL